MIIRVLDFETTGTEPPGEVCEVGYSDVLIFADGTKGRVRAPVSWLCGVERMTVETRAVHHIPPAALEGLAPFDPAAFAARAAAEGVAAVAAHRADFEGRWVGAALAAVGVPLVCSHKAALRVWPDAPAHNNQVLRYWLDEQGLTSPDPVVAQPAHRAGPDAYATAHTVRAILALGHTLENLIAWTAEPALLPRIPIGKQRGAKWADVDGGFLRWMLSAKDMDSDLVWNARRELERRAAA
jgi:exodeoxyribonuclease X